MDCSRTISNGTLAICQECAGDHDILEEPSDCHSPCYDLERMCNAFCTYQSLQSILDRLYTQKSLICLSITGIISNFCVFVALLSKSLAGSTFTFLRFITVVHMLQAVFAILQIKGRFMFPEGLVRVFAQEFFWAATPALKLTSCVATFFLTFERFLAVCYSRYQLLNMRVYIRATFIISAVIGCLEMLCLPQFTVEYNTNSENETQATWVLFYQFFDRGIIFLIIAIKSAVTLLMFVFMAVIVRKLRARAVNVAGMVSTAAAKKTYQEVASLCRFQMIDTVVVCLDTMISVSANAYVVLRSRLHGNGCFLDTAFETKMGFFEELLNFMCDTNLSCAHFELFFIYLMFFGTFRRGFFGELKRFALYVAPCLERQLRLRANSVAPSTASIMLTAQPAGAMDGRSISRRGTEAL